MENQSNINNHGVSVQIRGCYRNQVVYKKVFQKIHVITKLRGVHFSILSSNVITFNKGPQLLTTKAIPANHISKRRYANSEIQEESY